jgi:hypothetical protein
MKPYLLAMALAMNAAPIAASEDVHALQLRSKAAIETAAPHRSAPYIEPLGEPQRASIFAAHDVRHEESRSSCASDRALCYDPGSGHIVYKPARAFMPDLPGLAADSISLKRDRLVFKYSF